MSSIGYAYQQKDEKAVKAQAVGILISPKESYEIANAIKGMNVVRAKKLLSNVLEYKEPVPYRRYIHRSGIGHRKGHVGPGRYPQSSSKEFLKLLNLLQANAKFKGMNPENLTLKHVAAHKAPKIRHSFKGSPHSSSATHVEIVAIEEIPKTKEKKKGGKK